MLAIDNFTSVTEKLESTFLFLDLEVNSSNSIYRMGLSYREIALDAFEDDFSQVYQELITLKQKNISICGHNFRRFDTKYLNKQKPNFIDWFVVDTLELSVLASPLQSSHKLNKEFNYFNLKF